MNYVARAVLPREEAAKRQFYGVYGWHKAAWDFFHGMPKAKREELGFLFRADEDEIELCLTVVSKNKPVRPTWCSEDAWRCRELSSDYMKHGRYRFKLRVNPTRTTRKNSDQTPRNNKYGRHEAILKRTELKEWFERKTAQNGFKIIQESPNFELDIASPVFYSKQKLSKEGDTGTIIGVDFKGVLEVTDRQLFIRAFEKGIGRARSFGFGLLVIQPIQ